MDVSKFNNEEYFNSFDRVTVQTTRSRKSAGFKMELAPYKQCNELVRHLRSKVTLEQNISMFNKLLFLDLDQVKQISAYIDCNKLKKPNNDKPYGSIVFINELSLYVKVYMIESSDSPNSLSLSKMSIQSELPSYHNLIKLYVDDWKDVTDDMYNKLINSDTITQSTEVKDGLRCTTIEYKVKFN